MIFGASKFRPIALLVFTAGMLAASTVEAQPAVPATEPAKAASEGSAASETALLPMQSAELAPEKTTAGKIQLQEGVLFQVELLDTIGSKMSKQGDVFRMKTTEDVVVQERVVIPAGSIGYGTITYAEPRRMLGQAGELFYRFDYLKVGDRHIKIRSSRGASGKDSTGSTIALVALFGVFGMLKKGADIEVPAGTQFEVYNAASIDFGN